MLMGAHEQKNEMQNVTDDSLKQHVYKLTKNAEKAGWKIKPTSNFEMFHFFAKQEELKPAKFGSQKIEKDASKPFCPDETSHVQHYLFIRVLSDVFPSLAPVIGGLPRSPCQDQCHWLRKLVKIMFLSTKILLLGKYPAVFSHITQLYDLGPKHSLLKSDISVHNKSDQRSAERLISDQFFEGIREIPRSKGTELLLLVGKRGFEAWWICDVYFVCKVIRLRRKYLELAGFNLRKHFISQA